jgi:hypothetical protein
MLRTVERRKAMLAFVVSFGIASFNIVSPWLLVWPFAFGLLMGNGNRHDIGEEVVRGITFGFLGWIASGALQAFYFQFLV